jgi:hypothetical protein
MHPTSRRRRAARLLGALALAQVVLGASTGSAHDDFFTDDFFFGDFDVYRRRSDSITFGHGNAVAHNIAVQTIDPWPPYVGRSRIDVNGERLLGRELGKQPSFVGGVRGYKENKSIPPKALSTQQISITPTNGASITGN